MDVVTSFQVLSDDVVAAILGATDGTVRVSFRVAQEIFLGLVFEGVHDHPVEITSQLSHER